MAASLPQGEHECTTWSLQWAGLITTIVSINVTWWLLDVPLLFTHGVRRYLNAVTWQCFRLYMPSIAAIYALSYARNHGEEPLIYYSGPFGVVPNPNRPAEERRPAMTAVQIAKRLVVDCLTIVATGITINTAVHLPAGAPASGIAFSTWSYPTLPSALIGLWLLLCSWIKWSRTWTIWLGLLLILGVGVAIGVPVGLLSEAGKQNGLWIAAIIGYAFMALPIFAYNHGGIVVVGTALGLMFRVGGIAFGAMSDAAYFPFCQLKSRAFGITYLVIGCVGAALGIWGRIKFFGRLDPGTNPRNNEPQDPQNGQSAPVAQVPPPAYSQNYTSQPWEVRPAAQPQYEGNWTRA